MLPFLNPGNELALRLEMSQLYNRNLLADYRQSGGNSINQIPSVLLQNLTTQASWNQRNALANIGLPFSGRDVLSGIGSGASFQSFGIGRSDLPMDGVSRSDVSRLYLNLLQNQDISSALRSLGQQQNTSQQLQRNNPESANTTSKSPDRR